MFHSTETRVTASSARSLRFVLGHRDVRRRAVDTSVLFVIILMRPPARLEHSSTRALGHSGTRHRRGAQAGWCGPSSSSSSPLGGAPSPARPSPPAPSSSASSSSASQHARSPPCGHADGIKRSSLCYLHFSIYLFL